MPFNRAMANFTCLLCGGGGMKGHGKAASGTKRWQCTSCKATSTHSIDNAAKLLPLLLKRLPLKKTQSDTGIPARTSRRRTTRFWALWPLAPVCDEAHRAVFADGVWPRRDAVVLTVCAQDHVVGWHLARSEHAQAWAAFMARIAAPNVIAADGGQGFEKAQRAVWPRTRVQRCALHAFCQVKRQATTRPKLEAGAGLCGIAKDPLHVDGLDEATVWLARLSSWRALGGLLKGKDGRGRRGRVQA